MVAAASALGHVKKHQVQFRISAVCWRQEDPCCVWRLELTVQVGGGGLGGGGGGSGASSLSVRPGGVFIGFAS